MRQRTRPSLRMAAIRILTLIAVLWCGAAFAPRAFADEGAIVIEHPGASDMRYKAYQLFAASVDDDGVATTIGWASDEARVTTLDFIQTTGYLEWLAVAHPEEGQEQIAQNAAEYIALMIGGPNQGVNEAAMPQTNEQTTFSSGLARALASNPAMTYETFASDQDFAAAQGFWLVVADPESLDGENRVGTSPLWIPLGQTMRAINDKSMTPTVNKDVFETSSGTWGKFADAFRKEPLDFRITATLPRNLADFEHYHLCLIDTHSDGLQLALPEGNDVSRAVGITIGDVPLQVDGANVRVAYDGKSLTIDFLDLKSDFWGPYDPANNTVITVIYQAQLNERAVVGSAGNSNEVNLVYSCDPTSDAESTIRSTPVKVYTHTLRLHKICSETSRQLSGARFTIKTLGASARDPRKECYVQADGSLGTTPHEFTTGPDGIAEVQGVDSGDFAIAETAAPSGYRRLESDIQMRIQPTIDETDNHLAKLTATSVSDTAHVSDVSAEGGVATIAIKNSPAPKPNRPVERLAQTGVGPIAATLALAGIVVMAIAHLTSRSRRRPPRRHRSY